MKWRQIEVFVFDKDGLLFKSHPFWVELATRRLREIQKLNCPTLNQRWIRSFGVRLDRAGKVESVDRFGIMALASPTEEIVVSAGLIAEETGCCWIEAREKARAVFQNADTEIDLKKALVPRKGFPAIFSRLRAAGIPYGIATSDTHKRTVQSLSMFDDPAAVSFIITPEDVQHGKPAPDMLIKISHITKVAMKNIAMLGDSYVDMEMASLAGAVGIGIPEDESMKQRMRMIADLIIEDLDGIQI